MYIKINVYEPGLCYAEFGARVPKAGSAYIYSYVTVGEFIAFLIGWTLILEYMIGSASVVRGLSDYVDGLFNKSMSKFFTDKAALKIDHLSEYPDFFAFLITMLFSGKSTSFYVIMPQYNQKNYFKEKLFIDNVELFCSNAYTFI